MSSAAWQAVKQANAWCAVLGGKRKIQSAQAGSALRGVHPRLTPQQMVGSLMQNGVLLFAIGCNLPVDGGTGVQLPYTAPQVPEALQVVVTEPLAVLPAAQVATQLPPGATLSHPVAGQALLAGAAGRAARRHTASSAHHALVGCCCKGFDQLFRQANTHQDPQQLDMRATKAMQIQLSTAGPSQCQELSMSASSNLSACHSFLGPFSGRQAP